MKIALVGFLWGSIEAAMLFAVFLIPGLSDFLTGVPGFGFVLGLPFALLIAFLSGIVLSDVENIMEALFVATLVSVCAFMVMTIVLALSIPISLPMTYGPRSQGETELVYFGILTPIYFLAGFLTSAGGAWFGGWTDDRRRRRSQELRPLPPLG